MKEKKEASEKTGRPIEYPNSPLHEYWRTSKRAYRAKKRAEEAEKAEAFLEESVMEDSA